MKDLSKTKFPPVGRCIFCGRADGLTREHIVPFGLCDMLDGTGVLPEATCREHAMVTGTFERIVLRGPMWAVRVLRRLKSRSKHADAPRTYSLSVVRNGVEKPTDLPLDEYPVLLHFPRFSPPAYLSPDGYVSGITLQGVDTVSFGPKPIEAAKRLGASKISIPSEGDQPVAFARMIAKIAFAMAIAEKLVDPADSRVGVIPSILGHEDQIGRWVGTLPGTCMAQTGLLHRIAFHEDRANGLLVGEVQLFADSQAPSYGVIMRRLEP